MASQIWARYNESNPGSGIGTAQAGNAAPTTFDIGIRRIRLVLSGQLNARTTFFVQFGQNSLNPLSPRKVGSFFHDVTADYAVVKKHFIVGIGLMGWDGPGRFSNSSVPSILGVDLPVFQETQNDVNDQNIRKLGVYTKGKLGKLDYRVAVSTPFVVGGITQYGGATAPQSIFADSTHSTYNTYAPKLNYQGYFMYQFLDQESNFGPGVTGTYLGKKRVFNIGAGFVYQDKAMFNLAANRKDTVYNPLVLWCVDVFYDAPLNAEKGTAVSFYGGYFNYNFGPGYFRNIGSMNPANTLIAGQASSVNGAGNGYPALGTGSILYAQAGYLLRRDLLASQGTLQPYVTAFYANYDRFKDPVTTYGAGVNWLISGHNQKITFAYQSRPIFKAQANGDVTNTERKGEWIIQYQLAF